VAQEVGGRLTLDEQARLAPRRAVKPEVYEAFLRGQYFANRGSEEGLKKAVENFQEAIRLDPNYAPAYAGLADAYAFLGFGWANIEHPEVLAMEAAKKAIALDDSLAEAHTSLAYVLHRYMQDWAGAEREFKRALELNPNYAWARRYGVFFNTIGLDDAACREFRLAHEMDPLNSAFGGMGGFASCISEAGHFDEAVRIMKNNVEMDPNDPSLRWEFGDLYERKRMFPEAIEQYQKGVELSHRNPMVLTLLASAYAGSGQTAKAEKLLEEIKKSSGNDRWFNAVIYARMGRKEQAIRELMKDTENCGPGTCGPGSSLYISEWRFTPLRSDPRFQALLRKFNYPDSAFRK
jgi:tetratricopeptide (TPR) repeat protein